MRLIDADVLIKHLCEIMTTANRFGNIERVSEIGACIGVVKGEKTIEQPDGKVRCEKQINAEWIQNTRYNRKGKIFLNCSACHYGDRGDVMCFTSSIPNYCPNCGAKMSFEKGGDPD